MGIAEEYVKRVKTPLIKVTLTKFADDVKPGITAQGEDYYAEAVNCEITYGFDQASTTCSLTLKPPRDLSGEIIRFAPMSRVKVEQGWNISSTMRTTFFGFVDKVDYSNAPETLRMECRDTLKLAQDNYYIHSNRLVYSATADDSELDEDGNPMGGQAIEDRQAQVILTDILTGCGIPEDYLHLDFVEYPESGAIIIGNNATAVFVYESAMDAATRVCDLIGYRLWSDKTGQVQCREVRPIASSTASQTYRSQTETYDGNGVWTIVNQGNLLGVQASKDDDLRNWVEVIGWGDIKSTVAGESDYVPSPPTYRRTEIRSYLLDTPELVTAVAERVYTDLNRLRYLATATIEGDPRLEIGQTIEIYDPYTTETTMKYFLYDFTSSMGGGRWTMELSLVGGIGTGSEPIGNVSPIAMFAWSVEQEKLADGTQLIDVMVDASPSYDPDGPLSGLDYTWVVSGFANRTDIKTVYVVSGLTVLEVTLIVGDSGTPPLTNQLTQTIPLDTNVKWKTIFAITSSEVWYTDDGGLTWDTREIY